MVAAGPRVTIVVPTFERPAYLDECLSSVKGQTYIDYQVVVLDNASATSYAPVLARHKGLPIRYVRNRVNIGSSRNIAKAFVDYRESEYLLVFHDDDLMHPRMLEWQVALLDADLGLRFVGCEYESFSDDMPRLDGAWPSSRPKVTIHPDAASLARYLLAGDGVCLSSVLYRTEALEAVALDFARFNMYWDRPFLLDIAGLGSCAVMNGPLVRYRVHSAQDSKSDALRASNLLELMRSYRDALGGANVGKRDREVFLKRSAWILAVGYGRLSDAHRPGLADYLRRTRAEGLLRLRDLTASEWSALLRGSGHAWLPDAGVAARNFIKCHLGRAARDPLAAGDP